MPPMSSAVKGSFSASATRCITITAFGRDSALLKPRKAWKTRTAGSTKANAPR